jgi:hypothetical protein
MSNHHTLEQKVKSLERKYTTLYHRYYAMVIRRADLTKNAHLKASRLVKEYEKNKRLIHRAAKIIEVSTKRNARPIYLTLTQRNKLHYFLKQDFRRA